MTGPTPEFVSNIQALDQTMRRMVADDKMTGIITISIGLEKMITQLIDVDKIVAKLPASSQVDELKAALRVVDSCLGPTVVAHGVVFDQVAAIEK